ncbi:glycoside hydrolase [Thalassotalea crassostreae]|uniref:glycoside hydrolase n=1 Tax=Thalassotalea crassostreae TaxID=1763536 RepID=UPI000837BD45|nr:glycoside hydrolase [Thalassotalea crassostreae]
MKTYRVTYLKKLFFALLYLTTATQLNAQENIAIKFNIEHQEIDSFGASDAWTINPLINDWLAKGQNDEIEELADTFFSTDSGIGLSGWRFNIGAGSAEQGSNSLITLDNLGKDYRRAELLQPSPNANIDKTKQLGQIRFLQEAYERNVHDFVAFANSPPVWATKNGLAHPNTGTGVDSTNLKPDMVDDYANFLVNVLEYLRGNEIGVPVNYISPINEPTWEWQGKSQEANRYNMSDLVSVYTQLHTALENAGLDSFVDIDGGEVVEYTAALNDSRYKNFSGDSSNYNGGMNGTGQGLYRNYINELLGDELLRAKLGNKISLHGYFSDAWSDRMGSLRDTVLANVKEVSPEAKIWMSEFAILGGTGDVRNFEGNGWNVNDMDYALHIAKVLHRDLTRLNVSAWYWWLGVTPYNYKDGLIKVNSDLDANSIQPSKVLWTLGNYSRFIRPGYIRVGLDNVDNINGVMASSYRSPDSKKLVLVATNVGTSAQPLSFEISGLPQGKSISSMSTHITNANNNLVSAGITNFENVYQIPAKSIVTFVADLVDNESTPIVSFTQNRALIEEGSAVTFSSTTSNSPDSLQWVFIGGTPETSTSATQEVTYLKPGNFNVTLNASNAFGSDSKTITNSVEVIAKNTQACSSSGYLNIETWSDLSETGDYNYDSSTASIPLNTAGDSDTISTFEIQSDSADNYATRIQGYLCAPLTGEYIFWIAADNSGELWLSSDDNPNNKTKIAYSNDWTDFQDWDKYGSQQSSPIYLIAGQKYYVETLHKEHNGNDNLSVGWQLPDNTLERPILQTHLSPLIDSTTPDPTPTPMPESDTENKKSSGGSQSLYSLLFILWIWGKRKFTFKV